MATSIHEQNGSTTAPNRLRRVVDAIVLLISVLSLSLAITLFVQAKNRDSPLDPRASRAIAGWPSVSAIGHSVGPSTSGATVVVFEDFECPYCAVLEVSLKNVRARVPDLRVVYRHYPLPQHVFALPAAIAAECASRQGRFSAFHDSVFAGQTFLGKRKWKDFAMRSGVPDIKRFERCRSDDSTARGPVDRDRKVAIDLGLAGTPSVIVNGLLLGGTPTEDALVQALQAKK